MTNYLASVDVMMGKGLVGGKPTVTKSPVKKTVKDKNVSRPKKTSKKTIK